MHRPAVFFRRRLEKPSPHLVKLSGTLHRMALNTTACGMYRKVKKRPHGVRCCWLPLQCAATLCLIGCLRLRYGGQASGALQTYK